MLVNPSYRKKGAPVLVRSICVGEEHSVFCVEFSVLVRTLCVYVEFSV